jgi:hypothetical protein
MAPAEPGGVVASNPERQPTDEASMKRRSIRPLLASWLVYWAIVGIAKLGPPALAIWRATRGPDTNTSSVSVSVANLVLQLVVVDHGQAAWSGASHVTAIAAWIAVVPVVMTVAWLARTRANAPVRQPA